QAEDVDVLERRQQALPDLALLETLDGLDAREQERQVEDLEPRRQAIEHGQRRGDHLDLAERERLERVAVVHQLCRRVHLDADAPWEARLGELLEALGGMALRRLRRGDVRKLDYIELGVRRSARGEQRRERQHGDPPAEPRSVEHASPLVFSALGVVSPDYIRCDSGASLA